MIQKDQSNFRQLLLTKKQPEYKVHTRLGIK